MIVVDATVWVDLLLGQLDSRLVEALTEHDCVSPPHVDFEVGGALLRIERSGKIDPGVARILITQFAARPLRREYDPADQVAAVDLAGNNTYADAWYLALAHRLGVPIMTLDSGMREGARINNIEIAG